MKFLKTKQKAQNFDIKNLRITKNTKFQHLKNVSH